MQIDKHIIQDIVYNAFDSNLKSIDNTDLVYWLYNKLVGMKIKSKIKQYKINQKPIIGVVLRVNHIKSFVYSDNGELLIIAENTL